MEPSFGYATLTSIAKEAKTKFEAKKKKKKSKKMLSL